MTESITSILSQDTIDLTKKEQWRNQFLANIKKSGLEIEEEIVDHGKKALVFLKIHATWPVLCRYAEELNLRAPLLVRKRLLPSLHPPSPHPIFFFRYSFPRFFSFRFWSFRTNFDFY